MTFHKPADLQKHLNRVGREVIIPVLSRHLLQDVVIHVYRKNNQLGEGFVLWGKIITGNPQPKNRQKEPLPRFSATDWIVRVTGPDNEKICKFIEAITLLTIELAEES